MNPEEQDPLWELLGKARRQEPGTFFARNVARQARLLGSASQQAPTPFFAKLLDWFQSTPIALPAMAVAVAACGLIFNLAPTTGDATVTVAPIPAATQTGDRSATPNEIVEFADELGELDEINELLAVQDVSAIDDAAIALLLF